jgi:hypothetical protein
MAWKFGQTPVKHVHNMRITARSEPSTSSRRNLSTLQLFLAFASNSHPSIHYGKDKGHRFSLKGIILGNGAADAQKGSRVNLLARLSIASAPVLTTFDFKSTS